jgi:hypothetical protein
MLGVAATGIIILHNLQSPKIFIDKLLLNLNKTDAAVFENQPKFHLIDVARGVYGAGTELLSTNTTKLLSNTWDTRQSFDQHLVHVTNATVSVVIINWLSDKEVLSRRKKLPKCNAFSCVGCLVDNVNSFCMAHVRGLQTGLQTTQNALKDIDCNCTTPP